MGASSRALAAAAAAACTLAACDALLGLDKYQDVACALDCGPDAAETGPHPDVLEVGPPADVFEASFDAEGGADVADAEAGLDVADAQDSSDVVAVPDGWPPATAHEIWAHWPMPNPDAAISPDSSTPLPHPMSYDAGVADAGPDAGPPFAYDNVTKLTWNRVSIPAGSIGAARLLCSQVGDPSWRVPTRIELVSLIDYTQPSAPLVVPGVFLSVQPGAHWTSSPVPGPDGGPSGYWTVDFNTGLASNTGSGSFVLCVSGGAP